MVGLCCRSRTSRPAPRPVAGATPEAPQGQQLGLWSGRPKGSVNASSPGTNTSPEPLTPLCRGRGEAAGGVVYEWVLWLSHPVAGGPCLRSQASACLFPHQTNGNVSASEGGCKAQTRFWSDCLSLRGQEDRALLRQLRAQRSCPWCPASAPQCLGQEGGAVKGVEGSHTDPSPDEEPVGGLSLLPCKAGTQTPSAQGCGVR